MIKRKTCLNHKKDQYKKEIFLNMVETMTMKEASAMTRVYTLYRVSSAGQVDHDDIPMQRIACQEFAQAQPDWEIIKEFYEKVRYIT